MTKVVENYVIISFRCSIGLYGKNIFLTTIFLVLNSYNSCFCALLVPSSMRHGFPASTLELYAYPAFSFAKYI